LTVRLVDADTWRLCVALGVAGDQRDFVMKDDQMVARRSL
jgi:hypothetical protein